LVSRRTVGIDRDIMEKLKEIARKRGMGISQYLRKLIQEALELEKMGYYAREP
jgi:Ribbon-helix-helix protein, copG family.